MGADGPPSNSARRRGSPRRSHLTDAAQPACPSPPSSPKREGIPESPCGCIGSHGPCPPSAQPQTLPHRPAAQGRLPPGGMKARAQEGVGCITCLRGYLPQSGQTKWHGLERVPRSACSSSNAHSPEGLRLRRKCLLFQPQAMVLCSTQQPSKLQAGKGEGIMGNRARRPRH